MSMNKGWPHGPRKDTEYLLYNFKHCVFTSVERPHVDHLRYNFRRRKRRKRWETSPARYELHVPIYPVIFASQTMGEPQHYHGYRRRVSPGQLISHCRCHLQTSQALQTSPGSSHCCYRRHRHKVSPGRRISLSLSLLLIILAGPFPVAVIIAARVEET